MDRLAGLWMITGIESCILALLMISCSKGGGNDSAHSKNRVAVWEIRQYIFWENEKNAGNDIADGGKVVLNDGKIVCYPDSGGFPWEYFGRKLKNADSSHQEILNATEFSVNHTTVGCFSGNGDEVITDKNYVCVTKDSGKAGDLVGTWRHRESRNIRGKDRTLDMSYVFRADGTFTFAIHEIDVNGRNNDQILRGTYAYRNGKITKTYGNGFTDSAKAVLYGNRLVYESDIYTGE